MSDEDKKFMREALLEAKKAFSKKEVPVGAVLVHQGRIIAHAHNAVEELQIASAHAELICLKEGAKILGNWRLLGTTLYSTLEPCIMCFGAMVLFRIKRLVYGAKDLRHGAEEAVVDVLSKHHPIHNIEVTPGVYEKEAGELMTTFFQERRYGKII